ncbi:DUF6473 family protein [Pseudooceanicola nanhaiensis]|uniref:DUF6473 family protein n=1 Tax=Pseudooceanicola nanhaiensis TaxID=375761 RepID=UPI001CD6EF82|nr:DUF6473 family protein [Pseudooceanicola nanhaiensis]MCA0920572.1 DUF6473 family protein [Pseudooceanicola nanhaiensis]
MTYEKLGQEALEYYPCRYGRSKILFRGPKRTLDGPYVAFLGGSETYGKFIPRPFPALVEDELGTACVNLGWMNAGVDAFLHDPAILQIASGAKAVVIQVMGAQNMSNRFYGVHPRRNDRFLQASELLRTVFRDVDFTEFHFTRHMLQHLRARSEERFEMVRGELKAAWSARMDRLLSRIGAPVVLLWLSNHAPGDAVLEAEMRSDPLFVDRSMIEALRPRVQQVVEVIVSAEAQARRGEGMVFNELEAPAAAEMLGLGAQVEAAKALVSALQTQLQGRSGREQGAV